MVSIFSRPLRENRARALDLNLPDWIVAMEAVGAACQVCITQT